MIAALHCRMADPFCVFSKNELSQAIGRYYNGSYRQKSVTLVKGAHSCCFISGNVADILPAIHNCSEDNQIHTKKRASP